MAALTSRGPLVLTPHYHGMSQSRFRDMLHRPYRVAGSLMMRRASRVIAVAPSEAALIARHFPLLPRACRPNGDDMLLHDDTAIGAHGPAHLVK